MGEMEEMGVLDELLVEALLVQQEMEEMGVLGEQEDQSISEDFSVNIIHLLLLIRIQPVL